jgi:hypothetical protein
LSAALPHPNSAFPGLDHLFGFATVDGVPLKVYGVQQLGTKAVCYIESTSGAEFQVHFRDERRNCTNGKSFLISLHADGESYVVSQVLHCVFPFPY